MERAKIAEEVAKRQMEGAGKDVYAKQAAELLADLDPRSDENQQKLPSGMNFDGLLESSVLFIDSKLIESKPKMSLESIQILHDSVTKPGNEELWKLAYESEMQKLMLSKIDELKRTGIEADIIEAQKLRAVLQEAALRAEVNNFGGAQSKEFSDPSSDVEKKTMINHQWASLPDEVLENAFHGGRITQMDNIHTNDEKIDPNKFWENEREISRLKKDAVSASASFSLPLGRSNNPKIEAVLKPVPPKSPFERLRNFFKRK